MVVRSDFASFVPEEGRDVVYGLYDAQTVTDDATGARFLTKFHPDVWAQIQAVARPDQKTFPGLIVGIVASTFSRTDYTVDVLVDREANAKAPASVCAGVTVHVPHDDYQNMLRCDDLMGMFGVPLVRLEARP